MAVAVPAVLVFTALVLSMASGARGAESGVESGAEAAVRAINRWLRQIDTRGARVPLRIAPGSYGLGVFATRDLAADEVLLRIGLEWVLCATTIARSKVGPALGALGGDVSNQLALFVLHEHARAAQSKWAPWLAILPNNRTLTSSVLWTASEIALLTGDPVLGTVRRNRESALAQFAEHVAPFCHAQQRLFPPHVCNESAFLWARALIDSRAWTLSGVRYFVPVADLFNYAPSSSQLGQSESAAPAVRGARFMASHRVVGTGSTGQTVEIAAEAATASGAEVTESYGDNEDAIYLAYHGFVPAANPDACVPVPMPMSMPTASSAGGSTNADAQLRLALMADLGAGKVGASVCLRDGSRAAAAPLAIEAAIALTVAELSHDELAFVQRRKGNKGFRAAFAAYARTWPFQAVHRTARAGLAAFPTTLAADEQRLATDQTLSANARVALEFVAKRKRILKSALDHPSRGPHTLVAWLHARKAARAAKVDTERPSEL